MELWAILIIVFIGIATLIVVYFQCKNKKKQSKKYNDLTEADMQLLKKSSSEESHQIKNIQFNVTGQSQQYTNFKIDSQNPDQQNNFIKNDQNNQQVQQQIQSQQPQKINYVDQNLLDTNQNNQVVEKQEEIFSFNQQQKSVLGQDQSKNTSQQEYVALNIHSGNQYNIPSHQQSQNFQNYGKSNFDEEQQNIPYKQQHLKQVEVAIKIQEQQIYDPSQQTKQTDYLSYENYEQPPKTNIDLMGIEIQQNFIEQNALKQNQNDQYEIQNQIDMQNDGQQSILPQSILNNNEKSIQIVQEQNLDQINLQNKTEVQILIPIDQIQVEKELKNSSLYEDLFLEIQGLLELLLEQKSLQNQKDIIQQQFENKAVLKSLMESDQTLKNNVSGLMLNDESFSNLFQQIVILLFKAEDLQLYLQDQSISELNPSYKIITKEQNEKIRQLSQLIEKLKQLNFTEVELNHPLQEFPKLADNHEFIMNLYEQTSKKRAVEDQFKPYVRNQFDFNEMKKNYGLPLIEGRELKAKYCDTFRPVRGDGNCFYSAFGFQFLHHLLINYKQDDFLKFIDHCLEIKLPMKIHLSENEKEITNEKLENDLLKDFLHRLINLRQIQNLQERYEQLTKQFAAYEYQNEEIDGCFYALSTIFLRNYSNYAVESHEMIEALFDRINLLVWEKECNSNEIVIDALSRKLNLHTTLIYFEDRSFKPMEYGDQNNPKIILLIRPGHYNIGINQAYEIFLRVKKLEERIFNQSQHIYNFYKTIFQESEDDNIY